MIRRASPDEFHGLFHVFLVTHGRREDEGLAGFQQAVEEREVCEVPRSHLVRGKDRVELLDEVGIPDGRHPMTAQGPHVVGELVPLLIGKFETLDVLVMLPRAPRIDEAVCTESLELHDVGAALDSQSSKCIRAVEIALMIVADLGDQGGPVEMKRREIDHQRAASLSR